jgi:hypothetical protein
MPADFVGKAEMMLKSPEKWRFQNHWHYPLKISSYGF